MSQILSIKYRPKKFSEVKGQEHAVSIIKTAVQTGSLPPTILLSGIRGTGKTTIARLIAKYLNCSQKGEDLCGQCESCTSTNHLDILEIDAASHTGVDHIREIIDSAQYKAVMGQYKVFIIDEVHMLSKSAFNALLKNLEEPYPHVKYILATTELQKIPDTIMSRCMRLNMATFSNEQIVDVLQGILDRENYRYEHAALLEIGHAAGGSLRDAQNILNQALLLTQDHYLTKQVLYDMLGTCDRQVFFDLTEGIFGGNIEEILNNTRQLTSKGIDPILILQNVMDIVYWLVCLKQIPDLATNPNYPELDRTQGLYLADQLDMSVLLIAWQALQKGYQEYIQSPLKQQTLEMVLLRICFIPEKKTAHSFESFDRLMQFLRKSKEPLFHTAIKDLPVVSYAPGNIVFEAFEKNSLHDISIHKISEKLKGLTGIDWCVTIKDEGNISDTVKFRQHEIIQKIQEHYQDNIEICLKEKEDSNAR